MKNKEYTDLVDAENYPKNPLVPLDTPFVDDRGVIQNLLNCNIGSAAIITSKKDSERSNHYHKSSWHYLYIVSGSLKYYERNVDGSEKFEAIYKTGDLFYTPPNKVHKTVFLEDCTMMSFGKSPKDHDSHEEDLIREEF